MKTVQDTHADSEPAHLVAPEGLRIPGPGRGPLWVIERLADLFNDTYDPQLRRITARLTEPAPADQPHATPLVQHWPTAA